MIKTFFVSAFLVLGLLFAQPSTPLAAQCPFCVQTGGASFDCDGEDGVMPCGGTFFHIFCLSCEAPVQAALPVQLSPDGSVNTTSYHDVAAVLHAENVLDDGTRLLRSACNGAILERAYPSEAGERLRQTARTITL